ncbi:MAG TPA: neutral/alkaline non-lysosomal ceramidase N-terminal domain-containing protein [Candidatus Binatia bacterium]|nr:neutral/alkaline non-lysosomal ceramidase N-terminal domain-containing protein [Candidatus Binatia bacterium]
MRFVPMILLASLPLAAADYKAGIGRIIITPDKPIYMSGYANRNHPSEGVVHDLWAKALAIEDRKGARVVIVATDLIGLPRGITDVVAARVDQQWGIDRSHLVLNSSHTHTGPLIRGNLEMLFELSPADSQVVSEYAARLIENLVAVIVAALQDLAPAALSFGNGRATFAINRREPAPNGVKIGENPKGPTDPDVPVLKVTAPDGKLRAVLFGYACHNTTLTGEFYNISGDYAGFAQLAIEKANPGATAMFLMLAGADQNPSPRSSLELAERHGAELGTEVIRVLGEKLQSVRGPVRTAFQIVHLGFAPQSRETFESRLQDSNVHRARHASAMLKLYDERSPILSHYPYPVQAVRFGKDLTLVALGGEVVVDYVLRIKREYGSKGIIVAGYSNDVMSYIPSLRVLKEGGYEADQSMIYYGLPGPYDEHVEEQIMATVHQVLKRVGQQPRSSAQ